MIMFIIYFIFILFILIILINYLLSNNTIECLDTSIKYQPDTNTSYLNQEKIPSLDTNKILPLTKYDTNFNSYYYDTNNYDIQYHSLNNNDDLLTPTGTWLKDNKGKLVYIKWTDIPQYSTYRKPGGFPYGPSNYVPSYEDTLYLKYYTNKNNVKYEK